MMLEKVSYMILLKDFYGPLLTARQQDILNLYYENDLSLSEIADEMGISRQAVRDILKRAEGQLQQYEDKLGLLDKFRSTQNRVQKIYDLLKAEESDSTNIQEALKMLLELSELI